MKDLEDVVKKMSKMKKPKRENKKPVPENSREWLEKAYPPEGGEAQKVGGIGYVLRKQFLNTCLEDEWICMNIQMTVLHSTLIRM